MKKAIYTKKIGREVAKHANTDVFEIIFVIENSPTEWAVVKEGSSRALRVFSKKGESISYAKDYLKLNGGREMVIYNRFGKMIESKNIM